MYWLIESVEKIERLCKQNHDEAFVEIIPTSPTLHPTQNQICSLFIRFLNDPKGYMVPIKHSEAINLPYEVCEKLLNSIKKIYVRDKKEFLHYFTLKHLSQPPPSLNTYIPQLTTTHTHLKNLHKDITHLNIIIPLVKHYEVCENIFENYNFEEENEFYNNKAIPVFNLLESNAIKTDTTLYKHYFKTSTEGYAYTQYNFNTLTTRPSNTFGGINYPSLSKTNGERSCFIPENDFFLDIDISAYHPTILSKLINYKFEYEDIHKSFAEMYGVEYKEAKQLTFKQIYGGVFKQYKELPFFKKVIEYTEDLWDKFNKQGYIECEISKYRFYRDKLEDMNPQKLLNYLLQNMETSLNVLILRDIFKILRGKNTQPVLYVYDSFLLDVDKTEKEEVRKIMEVFKKYDLKVKYKKGINYNLDS